MEFYNDETCISIFLKYMSVNKNHYITINLHINNLRGNIEKSYKIYCFTTA